MTMRTLTFLLLLCAALVAAPAVHAQVTDAERAAARQLFKEGDDLQRAGKFPEALDKFQRAQQVFSAPTNMLRIAECQAALGRIVESTESYRAVVRTPLPAGSPPAFQTAVDQAKAELSQVEPRVPKVTVQVAPAGINGLQLQIDGQSVSAALIGEEIPLDPGPHKLLVFASGYVSSEQAVTLKEHESRSVPFVLKPLAGVTYTPGTAPGGAPPPPLPPPPQQQPGGNSQEIAPPPPGYVPPPPPRGEGPAPSADRGSQKGFLLGGHIGWEIPAGNLPLGQSATSSSVDSASISGGGVAYAFDGGFRFARRWYVGVTLEHASFGQGKDVSALGNAYGGAAAGNIQSVASDTTLLGLVFAVIVNPDRTSAYFELGIANRWYNFTATQYVGPPITNNYNSGEALLGLGLWIPAGRYIRILPKVTLGLGSFSQPDSSSSDAHAFVMLGLSGFYNLEM